MASSLQAQLQQAIMSGGAVGAQDRRGVEDGLGCTVGAEGGQAEDAESVYIDPDRVVVSGPSCKACRKRVASVVLLPCRHLCLCTECDQPVQVQACPLCLSLRNSSIEVFLSQAQDQAQCYKPNDIRRGLKKNLYNIYKKKKSSIKLIMIIITSPFF